MSLTRRQKGIVDQILQEELKNAIQGRRDGQKLLDRSLFNEEFELDEAGPEPIRVDNQVMDDALEEPIIDLSNDIALDVLTQFNKKLFPLIEKIINSHGMFPDKVTRIGDDIKDAFGDDLLAIQQVCSEGIADVLQEYAMKCGEMAISLIGESSEDDGDFEPDGNDYK